jgi:hypothetical protein
MLPRGVLPRDCVRCNSLTTFETRMPIGPERFANVTRLMRCLVVATVWTVALPAAAQEETTETVEAEPATESPPAEAAPADEPTAAEGDEEIDPAERSPIDGVKGHIGIGYFTDFAPLGMRLWFTRDIALDIGLDGSFSSGTLDGYQVAIDAGMVFALAHYHYAVAIARIGAGWRVNEVTGAQSGGARHDIIASAFLGVEMFLGAFGFPNVSLQGGYGLQAAWAVEGGTNFVIGASTPSLDVVSSGVVGFHIYL